MLERNTGSYRAASRCQFGGLMKYCPDGNVMTQKGFDTVILHPGLSAAGQRLTSTMVGVLGSPRRCTDPQRVIGQMQQMTQQSQVKGAKKKQSLFLLFPSSATGESF